MSNQNIQTSEVLDGAVHQIETIFLSGHIPNHSKNPQRREELWKVLFNGKREPTYPESMSLSALRACNAIN